MRVSRPNSRPVSLLRSLLMGLSIPGVVVAVTGMFIVFTLLTEEYDELQDSSLNSKAYLLLAMFERDTGTQKLEGPSEVAALLAFETATLDYDERTLFWHIGANGQIQSQSPNAKDTLLPDNLNVGMQTANKHRFAIVGNVGKMVVATPMSERNETITGVLLGVGSGFLLLGLLFTVAAYWAVRRSVGVIADLSRNIAEKDEHDLSPIDRQNSFAEIEPAINTLDTLMARLDTALAAERAFATNAAHELRTPAAICLAHVQRLKAQLVDPALANSATEIELGLKRLSRLIERLLQLSRAQSGLGMASQPADINPVISFLLSELRARLPDHDRLIIRAPSGIWQSRVDPDALGIILNNLFENAVKYTDGPRPIVADASQAGRIIISNDCSPLTPDTLSAIQDRFIRNAPLSEGFGIGLSIVGALCKQSGSTLELLSPHPSQERGFVAIITLPGGPVTAL